MSGADSAAAPRYNADELRHTLCQGYSAEACAPIAAALDLALPLLQPGRQSLPYGIDAALAVRRLKADAASVVAALLSDPRLQSNLPLAEIQRRFGTDIAGLVEKVQWLNTFTESRDTALLEPDQAELLRRMLLAVVNDVRAVLVKLAYRLERLRLLAHADYDTRRSIAQETLDIFAPLASRLGIAHLKWEMEDLAFRYLQPLEYGSLAKQLAETRAAREAYVQSFTEDLRRLLEQEGMAAKVYGRPKHLYSIWKKMRRKHLAMDELYDLRAVRVMVDSVAQCYAVLGMVHSRWQHIAKEFDDYIANPKPNGYRSLHTVVVGPEGKPVEIQIRTGEMHAFAEYGVAAHWRYKEGGGGRDAAFDRSIALLRGLLENPGGDHALLENFRLEVQGSDVFVLSPKGRIVRLPMGATPLDFAYAIHTEVGHHCRGAKVDGRMVPLTYALSSGEQVEILTGSRGGPSRHWLEPSAGFLHSSDARARVRQWFKQQDYEQHWRQGKAILDRERQRLGVREVEQKPLLEKYRCKSWEDFLAMLGRGEITPVQLANQLAPAAESPPPRPLPPKKPPPPPAKGQICIPGVPNPLTHAAGCCKPEVGDAVVGYLSANRGLSIHRRDCTNIQKLDDSQRRRLIEAYWAGMEQAGDVDLYISAKDRKGLLREVTQTLANEGLDITKAFSYSEPDSQVTLHIGLEHADAAALESALGKIRRLEGVRGIRKAGEL